MSQLILDDVYNIQCAGKDIDLDSYNFFLYEEYKTGITIYYDAVKRLSTKVIIDDPASGKLYFFNIFGLTAIDLMECDYASFIEYDDISNVMANEHIKEMTAAVDDMKEQGEMYGQ